MLRISTITLVALTFWASGAVAEDFDRVLLPVAVQAVPGAGHSVWSSDFWMIAAGDPSRDAGVPIGPLKPVCERCTPLPTLPTPAGIPFRPPLYWSDGSTPVGLLLYVRKSDAYRARFSLHVRDTASPTAPTLIPVVYDRDLHDDEISIIGIPMEAGLRHTLRIYDVNRNPNAVVRVHIFGSGMVLLSTFDVTLSLDPTTKDLFGVQVPIYPGFAEVHLDSILSSYTGSDIHVRLLPQSGGLRAWAFVSVTDTANRSAVYAPQ